MNRSKPGGRTGNRRAGYSAVVAVLAMLGANSHPEPQDAPVPAAEAAGRMTLPEGFQATLFAGEPDVVQPIAFATDYRGRLWVVECMSYPEWSRDGQGNDRVLIFEDTDGDGHFDIRKIFYDKGVNLSGIELGFGGVYLVSTPNLLFIPDRDGDDVPDGEPEILLDGWSLDAQHNVPNGLTWGPDGWLYGGNGILSTSMVGAPGAPDERRTPMDCGVWRYHPVTRRFEVVASGTTNPWGLDFDAEGELFITNCVIPHVFHVVPGGHYQRMFGQDINPYVYELLKTCADHFHWDTAEDWADIRTLGVTATTDQAGGGHAHAGAMIYLGHNWPEEYRGNLFTLNIHGHRANRDAFQPHRSTFIASHRPDFLHANDSWFRGLEMKYGPDGGVYVTDWSDTGECHEFDDDGAHRENGRIFKVTFGRPDPIRVDLAMLADLELVELQAHPNEWYVRNARRLLQERAATGAVQGEARLALLSMFETSNDARLRLRALLTLHAISGIDENVDRKALKDSDPAVRAWGVRLLVSRSDSVPDVVERLVELARTETSPRVRLHLASALRDLPGGESRRAVARVLASRGEDADDPMIPLMVWYGIEPLISDGSMNSEGVADLVADSRLPTVVRLASRRLVEADAGSGLAALLPKLAALDDSSRRLQALDGVLAALRGLRRVDRPASWDADRARLLGDADPAVRDRALLLGLKFGDEGAAGTLRAALLEPGLNPERRRLALDALLAARRPGLVADLRSLIDRRDPDLLGPAIRALGALDDEATPALLLNHYTEMPTGAKADIVAALASRPKYALALLDAIADGRVPRRDLSIAIARQIQMFEDDKISLRLLEAWGSVRPTADRKAEEVARYRAMLGGDALAMASAGRGREVFRRSCAGCHILFGEGSDIGPELTGSDRANLDYLLENVLDPSAVVARDYKLNVVATTDGRILSGLIREQDDASIVLQTPNERVVLPRDEIDEIRESNESMMPEGLFDELRAEEIRDLVAYLAANAPPPADGVSDPTLKPTAPDGR